MVKRDSYIRGATLLAGGMLIAKVIGAIYRIPLTNIIGAEGIGIYQLIFPVYALLITLTGSGIPITLSRLIAERKMQGDVVEVKALFRQSVTVFMIIGLAASIVLFALSNVLGNIQDNPYVAIGYKLLAPAIILSTGIAAIRGWFQGNMNMLPSAISQVAEQTVKLILGLVFAYMLLPRGVQYAVWGAIFAITLSELIALFILIIYFAFKGRKDKAHDFTGINDIEFKKSNQIVRDLIAVMIPITLGGLMLPLVQFIDSMMIVNLLKMRGIPQEISTAMYGILTGPVGSLINMPVVLTLAFAVSAIPVISGCRINRDINSIRAKSALSVKLTFVIGVPSSLALFALAEPIMSLLYPNFNTSELTLSIGLLQVTSLSIVLLAIMQIYTALLQATDRAYTPFVNMAIGGIFKIVLTIILIRYWGIYGAAISTIIAYAIVAVLNIIALTRWTGKNEILTKNISTILLSGVIMGLALLYIVAIIRTNNLITLLIGSISGIIIYGILLVLTNAFTREELEGMPLSTILIKITNIIRFWEKTDDNSSRNGE